MADAPRPEVPRHAAASASATTSAPTPRPLVSPFAQAFIVLASVVVIIAGMRASAEILAPILLGFVLATAVAPLIGLLSHLGAPRWLAWLVVIVGVAAIGLVIVVVLLDSATAFAQRLPVYQTLMADRAAELIRWLADRGLAPPESSALIQTNTQALLRTGARLLSTFVSGLYGAVLVLVIALLFLLASPLQTGRELRNTSGTTSHFLTFSQTVQEELLDLTQTNLVIAVIVTLWLLLFHVDFAVMWGLLVFFLGYIPGLGMLVAAMPPILLAFIQYGGTIALIVAVGLVAIVVILNAISNALTGAAIDLSPVVVFIAFMFWTWVLGPLGTLLAFPLTLAVKRVLESNPDTRWLAALMSRRAPPSPENGSQREAA